ncbi:DNA mismatch repair endonuclease MutL [Clostridium intestinale]|uniref:DNA mismatch repair endonuclease MutL n=1 Tax=Clostridium intestinale TaxID=36845 RepID=UPI002DD6550B|nr:DNA mismatch repair endonuclease MutL [Clostridium intestinale]WRY52995.1 DNA mismatch repair endonuclease MutL [Clostridium intestinale]
MKRINILDSQTSNKIAAGEVVERPFSVVKELVENSIDASSKNIIVEIENGGETLIKVIDDGDGIHKEDISKAFLPHATSKIKEVEDIYNIMTLGFRGEALASIASISKTILKSKTSSEDVGVEISLTGGSIDHIVESGVNKGTYIEVRDLFFNVPARKKFMKSQSRESALINDILTRIAIANPSIAFTLIMNGKKAFQTFGSEKEEDVLRTIYGKNILENLVSFEASTDIITVHGFVGKEEIARGSRNNQSIFINGRYIKNKTITASIENAFKSFATVNKFPFFVVYIETYPEFIDVNIHPTKAEIKFKDERILYKVVFDAVHNALKENVKASFMDDEVSKEEIYENVHFEDTSSFSETIPKIVPEVVTKPIYPEYSAETYTEQKSVELPVDLKSSKPEIKEITESYEISTHSAPISTESNNYDSTTPEPKLPPYRVIGQYNKTYILCEYNENLYIVDQHAAHEKYLFEKYYDSIKNKEVEIQPLLIPSVIQLTLDDYVYYEDNLKVFEDAGFTCEPFGVNTIAIKEVPYFLGKLDPKGLFLSILDNLKALGSGTTLEVKYNKIATLSCKSAVKANNELTLEEMKELINLMRFMKDPYHCPHGRPTIIKISNYELEKRFRRVT